MTTALAIHVRITPLVKTRKTASLVPVQGIISVQIVDKEITVVATLVGMESVQIQKQTLIALVRQHISENPVKLRILAIIGTAQVMERVRTVVTIMFVIVTVVSLERTVKQLIIAITRTVHNTACVTTNTTRTNVPVVRDTQVMTASILTVAIINAKIMQRVSMDTPITFANVHQVLWIIYVKRGISVIIRNAQGAVHVKMEGLVINVHVMLGL